jgi:hypothetical protein
VNLDGVLKDGLSLVTEYCHLDWAMERDIVS